MPDNLNTKKTGKNYQQKAKENPQKTNQYQQEAANEFLNTNTTPNKRSGYITPDFSQEAATENNVDKILKAGKKNQPKNNP
jgi:hypothetical protein